MTREEIDKHLWELHLEWLKPCIVSKEASDKFDMKDLRPGQVVLVKDPSVPLITRLPELTDPHEYFREEWGI